MSQKLWVQVYLDLRSFCKHGNEEISTIKSKTHCTIIMIIHVHDSLLHDVIPDFGNHTNLIRKSFTCNL